MNCVKTFFPTRKKSALSTFLCQDINRRSAVQATYPQGVNRCIDWTCVRFPAGRTAALARLPIGAEFIGVTKISQQLILFQAERIKWVSNTIYSCIEITGRDVFYGHYAAYSLRRLAGANKFCGVGLWTLRRSCSCCWRAPWRQCLVPDCMSFSTRCRRCQPQRPERASRRTR